MNIFQKIFSSLGGKKGFSEMQPDGFYPLANSNYTVKNLGTGDYLKLYTSWAFSCVSKISNAVAQLDRVLKKDKNSLDTVNHPHLDLITFDLLEQIGASLELTGSAFYWKYKMSPQSKTISELIFMRTDAVEIIRDATGKTMNYRYTSHGKQYTLAPEDVMHIKLFTPFDTYPAEYKGVSPMEATALQMEMDSTANVYNRNFFKNNGSIRDLLSTDQTISQPNKERLIDMWNNKFQGVNNAHKTAILDQGLKYQNVAMSQKELDFVESRRFTRDEVYAIYGVPKIIAGVSEDVNRATANVAEQTFMKYTILPVAQRIAAALNKHLFNGIGVFDFLNIVPNDDEQLAADWNNGIITLNEARQARGYSPVKGGDVLKLSPLMMSDTIETDAPAETAKGKDDGHNTTRDIVSKVFRKNLKGTPENKQARDDYGQKVREEKIVRTNNYETKYVQAIKEIWGEQERDILAQTHKGVSKKNLEWNDSKYLSLWLAKLGPLQRDVTMNEGTHGLTMVGINSVFDVGTDKLNKRMRKNITKFAKSVDKTTKERMFDIIDKGNEQGLGAAEISKNIASTFDEFDRVRAASIARTEITRASNEATDFAWQDSGVVKAKEWYTAFDERVCEYCNAMNGKVVKLGANFFDKGDTVSGDDGGEFDNTYSDIGGAPLHTNCRCTLLPVL